MINLQSTMSFFRDGSVSLGRLMGIEGNMHAHCGRGTEGNNVGDDERSRSHAGVGVGVGVPKNHNVNGFCASLLHHVIRKKTTSRNQ